MSELCHVVIRDPCIKAPSGFGTALAIMFATHTMPTVVRHIFTNVICVMFGGTVTCIVRSILHAYKHKGLRPVLHAAGASHAAGIAAAGAALSGKQAISAKALAATDQAVQNIKAKWQQGLDEAAKVIKLQQQCQYQCCS